MNGNRKRNLQKIFRLTEQEQEQLMRNMEKAQVKTFQDYARKMCLNGRVIHVDYSDFRNIITSINQANFELKKIGNNINQLARKMNSFDEFDINDFKSLQSDFEQLSHRVVQQISRQLKKLDE